MIVVSNSSPICYLILIEQIHLLPNMLGTLTVPESVIRELSDPSAPEAVRGWTAQVPWWLKVQNAGADPGPDLNRLHAGERDAIVLAQKIEADFIILDEKAARQAAKERGLQVTGLIGISWMRLQTEVWWICLMRLIVFAKPIFVFRLSC